MSKNSKAHKRGASRNRRASFSRSRRGQRSRRNMRTRRSRGGARKCWGMSRRRKNSHSRRTRRRGGSMGYAPFPNKGMLLDTSREYAQAGLNPQWKTDVAFDLAEVRSKQ